MTTENSSTANEWLLFRVTVGVIENIDKQKEILYVAAMNAEHACKLVNQWQIAIQEDKDVMALKVISQILLHPLYMPNDDGVLFQT